MAAEDEERPVMTVDGSAMARLFGRDPDDRAEDASSYDEVALRLTRAYCFSMDAGLGLRRARCDGTRQVDLRTLGTGKGGDA